jgi:hypothetical protein
MSKLQFKMEQVWHRRQKKIILVIGHWSLVILIVFLPLFVFADQSLPIAGPTSIGELLTSILNFVLKLVVPLAVIAIVWSGILFLTSAGKDDRITQAKKMFTWAIIGLVVALIGMGFVSLIKDILGAGK